MEEIIELIKENDVWIVLIAVVLINPKPLTDTVSTCVSKISPAFAEAQKQRREREKLERLERRERETDAIVALKETLLAYRNELAENKEERQQLQRELIGVIKQYERKDQQVIEVLRDMCQALKEQTDRLDELTGLTVKALPDPETEERQE